MTKICLLVLFTVFIGVASISATTNVGVISTPVAASTTFRMEKLEFEMELKGLSVIDVYIQTKPGFYIGYGVRVIFS